MQAQRQNAIQKAAALYFDVNRKHCHISPIAGNSWKIKAHFINKNGFFYFQCGDGFNPSGKNYPHIIPQGCIQIHDRFIPGSAPGNVQ